MFLFGCVFVRCVFTDIRLRQHDRHVPLFLFQEESAPGIECQICHLVFSSQSDIFAHYESAHACKSGELKPPFRCEQCQKTFTAKQTLKIHLGAVHGIGEVRIFPCQHCSKVYKYGSHLRVHMMCNHPTVAKAKRPRKKKNKTR